MSNASNWSTCEIVSCVIAAAVGLIVFVATRGAIPLVGALLVGVALGVILYVVLTRLFCQGARAAAPTAPARPAPTPAKPAAEAAPEARTPAAKPAPAEPEPTPEPQQAEPVAEAPKAPASAESGAPAGKPERLSAPRGGQPDDLKEIKGIGPKLEQLLHSMGIYHFDQIAAWGPEEVAWMDENLKGFKGRVSRDNWVEQARILASGGETEFSRRARKGDVY